jgi:hemerythrin
VFVCVPCQGCAAPGRRLRGPPLTRLAPQITQSKFNKCPTVRDGFISQGRTMAFFDWEARYSVGLPLIDRHHKVLVGYINQLAEALAEGHSEADLGKLLKGLRTYTKMHFNFEESLFEHYGYADQDAHREYHDKLVQRVDDFAHRFEAGIRDLGVELLEFLKTWLTDHILREDMAYSSFLREKMKVSSK